MIRTLVFLLAMGAAPLGAAPHTTETVEYYTVTGDTLSDLRRELSRKGVDEFWGSTLWWITWSADCDVDLEITITMPKLSADSNLSARDQKVWDAMIVALYRHELLHAHHGRRAAAEIHTTNCTSPNSVLEKWAKRDRILDRDTRHGETQGVSLDR